MRAGDRNDIGQVEFAFGVVVPDSVHQREGVARIERHDAAVAQPDRALLGIGVLGLDDAQQRAVIAEHEAAIRCGIGRPHTGNRDRRLRRAAPRVEQLGYGVGAQQRGVAEQHDNIGNVAPGKATLERGARSAQRIAGAARRELDDAGRRRDRIGNRIHVAANDNDGHGWIERPQRVDDIADHRLPGDPMQDLGARGFEAGALAGGEDDGGEAGSAHEAARPKVHGERNAIIEAKVARRQPPRQHTDCCGI